MAFTSFRLAACAWSAAVAHRLGIADEIDTLIVERTAALAEMRAAAGTDVAAVLDAAYERITEIRERLDSVLQTMKGAR